MNPQLLSQIRSDVAQWTPEETAEAKRIAAAIVAVFGIASETAKMWAWINCELMRGEEPIPDMLEDLEANALSVASKTGKDLDVCRDAMRPVITWVYAIGPLPPLENGEIHDAARIAELNRYFIKFRNSKTRNGGNRK